MDEMSSSLAGGGWVSGSVVCFDFPGAIYLEGRFCSDGR
jgi:hypothetical protein